MILMVSLETTGTVPVTENKEGREERLLQAEGDRLTAERIMLHKSRADMAAQLARLKAIQVNTLLSCYCWHACRGCREAGFQPYCADQAWV